MNVIKRLPPELVARIAAGEVVERPSSVLKELVENALDAGATRIAADIESGGIAKLRISDDGLGMSRDDLVLAVQPHATSKLADADQLHTLETLGFRGEALPSIASVSHFSIVSRQRPDRSPESEALNDSNDSTADNSIAWKIEVDGGRPEVPEPHPASGPYGTTVEARDLFYNLPARQKFLKGLAAEASSCADTFLRLALTRPDVAFTLRQGRSELIALASTVPAKRTERPPRSRSAQAAPELPASAYFRRAREALGSSLAEGLIEIDFSDRPNVSAKTNVSAKPNESAASIAWTTQGDESTNSVSSVNPIDRIDPIDPPYRLFGLLSPPAVTRPNRSAIYLTVNGRAVKDRTLTSALLESFRHLLPPKRFPVAVLYLELPGSDVDINVHPAKSEVRFRLASRIYALFYHAVRTSCGLDARVQIAAASNTQDSTPDACVNPMQFNASNGSNGPRFNSNGSQLGMASSPAGTASSSAQPKRFSPPSWSGKPFQSSPVSGVVSGVGSNVGSGLNRLRTRDASPRSDLTFPPSGPLFQAPAAFRDSAARLTPVQTLDAPLPAVYDLWPASQPTTATVPDFDPSEFQAKSVQEESAAPYGNGGNGDALEQPSLASSSVPAPAADYRIIGQAAGSYIVVEDESGVRLIDQHALHERILFERLLAAAQARSRGDSQGLLVPETVELSAAQAALVSSGTETTDLLSHLGFDCEPFGARSLLLRAVPAITRNASPGRLVSDLLEALALGDDAPNGGAKALRRWTLREKAAYILSCKAAIKAGERLTHDQMDALIAEFQAVAGPIQAGVLTCPHGRPLAMEISWYELERAVGRK